jgi:hypothetical protein
VQLVGGRTLLVFRGPGSVQAAQLISARRVQCDRFDPPGELLDIEVACSVKGEHDVPMGRVGRIKQPADQLRERAPGIRIFGGVVAVDQPREVILGDQTGLAAPQQEPNL